MNQRSRQRLNRRYYTLKVSSVSQKMHVVAAISTQGPNFCWHIDGLDKLKTYGFAVHGCIDGYVYIGMCITLVHM